MARAIRREEVSGQRRGRVVRTTLGELIAAVYDESGPLARDVAPGIVMHMVNNLRAAERGNIKKKIIFDEC